MAIPLLAGVVSVTCADWLVGGLAAPNAAEAVGQAAQRRRRPIEVDPRLLIVAVTRKTPGRLGMSNVDGALPRRVYGRLLAALDRTDSRTALLDVYFKSPSPTEDPSLIESLSSLRSLRVTLVTFGSGDFVGTADGIRGAFDPCPVYDPARMPRVALSSCHLLATQDGVYLGAAPIQDDASTGHRLLQDAFQAVAQFSGQDDQTPRFDRTQNRLALGSLEWTLQSNHGVLVNWPRERVEIPRMELTEAIAAADDPKRRREFAGRLIVVGDVRGGDDVMTEHHGDVPGVEFVANLVNTILPPDSRRVGEVPGFVSDFWSWFLATVAFGAAASRRLSWSVGVLAMTLTAAWWGPVVGVDQWGATMPRIAPTLAVCLAGALGLVTAQSPLARDDLRIPGVQEEATILFVDLRDSTRLLGDLGVQRYRRLVERLLGDASRIVVANGGLVERTLGDGLLAVFRTRPGRHHALRCADAVAPLRSLVHKVGASHDVEIRLAMGFETGMVTGGFVREASHRAWSSAGTAVNLAQRLQSASGMLDTDVVLGPVARRLVEEGYRVWLLGPVEAKGFDEPVEASGLGDRKNLDPRHT